MVARYKKHPGFILGFHGCDRKIGEAVLNGSADLIASENDYDWLGTGIYFWEGNPLRAYQFAIEAMERRFITKGQIDEPFVVGAVIDLGVCCNLQDQSTIEELVIAHELLKDSNVSDGFEMPKNEKGADKFLRHLDCAVVNYLHVIRELSKLPAYDSVRAAFHEGGELYEGSSFTKLAHIQIAVRNEQQILGYFRPRYDFPSVETIKKSLSA
ncbi:MAG: hypothetical protein AB7C98_12110 [Acidithiobacillus sp.]